MPSAFVSSAAWHELARATDRKRALWAQDNDPTQWVACGWEWDAVAVTPMHRGLEALKAMDVGTRSGYPVLVDHLRNTLYVLVRPSSNDVFAGLEGVRVLSRAHQLLMPRTPYGSEAADWVSAPREHSTVLVCADHFAQHLRELTTDLTHDRATTASTSGSAE